LPWCERPRPLRDRWPWHAEASSSLLDADAREVLDAPSGVEPADAVRVSASLDSQPAEVVAAGSGLRSVVHASKATGTFWSPTMRTRQGCPESDSDPYVGAMRHFGSHASGASSVAYRTERPIWRTDQRGSTEGCTRLSRPACRSKSRPFKPGQGFAATGFWTNTPRAPSQSALTRGSGYR
jgi:hypothetical protein